MVTFKRILNFLPALVLVFVLLGCQRSAMEEQTGSGTETPDSEYTEFGAKGLKADKGRSTEETLTAAPLLREASPIAKPIWLSVSAGRHSCAIAGDHTLWCWGDNSHGELGRGDCRPQPSLVPERIGAESNWSHVSVGDTHTCAIKTDGTLWCWGSNQFGELGLGSPSGYAWCPNPSPQQTVRRDYTDWSQVSAGMFYTCGIRSGELYCWGSNGSHQLGDIDTPQAAMPGLVNLDNNWTTVSAGASHVCAIKSDNTLWCWGDNSRQQIGSESGPHDLVSAPLQMEGGPYLFVDTGAEHTCAVAVEDRWMMCGGKFGASIRPFPTRAWDKMFWRSVSTSGLYACGIWNDNSLWCWGEYFGARIGDTEWRSVDSSSGTTCAIRADGPLYCWGRNQFGGIGDATTKNRLVPVPVSRPAD